MQTATRDLKSAPTWDEPTFKWSWRTIALRALFAFGKKASLTELYAKIKEHPKTNGNPLWRARVREVLENNAEFVRVGDGIWSRSELYTPEQVESFNRIRRAEYPLLGPRTRR